VNHGDFNPRLCGGRQDFIIPGEAAIVDEPSKGALDDPAPGENRKANLSLRLAHNVQGETGGFRCPVHQIAGVSTIGPDKGQPRITVLEPLQEQACTVAILYICTGHSYGQQEAQHVYDNMPFTALGAFGSIVAASPPFCVEAML
jgi:hypothetical protein